MIPFGAVIYTSGPGNNSIMRTRMSTNTTFTSYKYRFLVRIEDDAIRPQNVNLGTAVSPSTEVPDRPKATQKK